MRNRSLAVFVVLSLLVPALAPAAPEADASGYRDITRLGGSNAFCRPPLRSVADLQRLFQNLRGEIEQVLATSNWGGDPDDLFRAVQEGSVTERQLPAGSIFEWMIVRRRGKPEIAHRLRWSGKKPVDVYAIEFESNADRYTFVIPKACGNLALIGREALPAPVCQLKATPARDCVTRTITIDATGSTSRTGRVEVRLSVRHPDGRTEDLGAPAAGGMRWTKAFDKPGTYTFTATATAGGRSSAPCTATVELTPCPPECVLVVSPLEVYTGEEVTVDVSGSKAQVGDLRLVTVEVTDEEGQSVSRLELSAPFRTTMRLEKSGTYRFRGVAADAAGQSSTNACEATAVAASRLSIFADFLGGKERRNRSPLFGGSCEELIGAKLGLFYRWKRHFEVGAALGGAFNVEDIDHSPLFVDLEANYIGDWGFFGAGVGGWDLLDDDSVDLDAASEENHFFSPDALVHLGLDLRKPRFGRGRIQFMVEGRVFLDELDDVENNYLVWGGLRFRSH